ncbi:MAG: 23S rRNA (pseudouridine(1915)-N(3))-methyltransferase RlmH [Alphaproteobacteria bacterium]
MRITIVAVGRMRRGPERDLYEHYAGRITTWRLEQIEVGVRARLSRGELRAAEGEALIRALPSEAHVVALDRGGDTVDSEAFARLLARWHEAGVRDLAFVIGGAEGLAATVLTRAGKTLSLGPMTWPHLLARGMLAEQVYRAQQILAGHPYHRG